MPKANIDGAEIIRARREGAAIAAQITTMLSNMKDNEIKRVDTRIAVVFVKRGGAKALTVRAASLGHTGMVREHIVSTLRSQQYTVAVLTNWD